MFEDAVKDAYYESKGVIPGQVNDASRRGHRNQMVDESFCADDPLSLVYLELRYTQCDMVSRFQLGGQEDELSKYTSLCQSDIDAAVGNYWFFGGLLVS